jgi:hypothetical protein
MIHLSDFYPQNVTKEDEKLLAQALLATCGHPVAKLDRRGVGSGKTHDGLEDIAQVVLGLADGEAIYIFAPTKVLCVDIRDRLIAVDEQLSELCMVWSGRGATDDQQNQAMCPFHEAADLVSARGGDPTTTLCHTKNGQERLCKFHSTCGYRRQQIGLGTRKIIIMPHAMLSLALRENMGKPVLLFIDEDPYAALIDDRISFPLDDIIAPLKVPPPGPKGKPDDVDPTKFLASALRQVHDVLNEASGVVGTLGLPSADDAVKSINLLYRIVGSLPCSLKPNPTPKSVEKYSGTGALAKRVFSLISLLKAIKRSSDKEQVIGCRVKKREVTVLLKKAVNKSYADVPTIILSATAEPLILKKWWRRLEASRTEIPDAPNETVGHYNIKATAELLADGKALMKKVAAFVFRLSHLYRGSGGDGPDGVVIMQKAPAERLKEVAPSNVAVANFGAVAGLNDYQNVGFQLIVGRPLPHPDVLELMAEVIKGDVIDRGDADFYMGWYPKRPEPIKLKCGGIVPTKTEYHPDPIANAVLKTIRDGEVAQANRGRGLRRGVNNPLTTIFVSQQVPPVPVDEICEELPFGPLDIMVGKGLVLDANVRKGHWQIITAVVPEWFNTENAARKHFEQNAPTSVVSNGQTHISTLYGFSRLRGNDQSDVSLPPAVPFAEYVHAKLTLPGWRYSVLVFIDLAHGDPEQHAIRLLGPLDKFELTAS